MIRQHKNHRPSIHPSSVIDESSVIIGEVSIDKDVNVWPLVVIRGDVAPISIGEGTNVQDGTVIHGASDYPVTIGRFITIGHKALVHACEVGDHCLIGMGAIVLDGAVIGHHSIIGANATVTKGTLIPPYSMVLGTPAKVLRSLTEEEINGLEDHAKKYIELSKEYTEDSHE